MAAPKVKGKGKKSEKKLSIQVSISLPESVWQKLPSHLHAAGVLAQAGMAELTPADVVAFAVLRAAMGAVGPGVPA